MAAAQTSALRAQLMGGTKEKHRENDISSWCFHKEAICE